MKPSELLATPEKWTTGELARDAQGEPVSEDNERAVCWCINGAMLKCLTSMEIIESSDKITALVHGCIWQWNDAPGRTHSEVLELLKGVGL